MKTLTKLTLTTVAAMLLGATTLLAGPGPFDRQIYATPRPLPPTYATARQLPPAAPTKCERMTVNRAPRHGGAVVVACTKALKETLGCRLAAR